MAVNIIKGTIVIVLYIQYCLLSIIIKLSWIITCVMCSDGKNGYCRTYWLEGRRHDFKSAFNIINELSESLNYNEINADWTNADLKVVEMILKVCTML